jgi:hypothetical protein
MKSRYIFDLQDPLIYRELIKVSKERYWSRYS